ncbi:MAG: dehydrogenase [Pseudomonadota bacterium]
MNRSFVMEKNKIIRARAPLRLGLAGGGTDISPYCDIYGGATLNVTINKFAYASISANSKGKIKFEANDLDIAVEHDLDEDLSASELVLHRGVYERMMQEYNGGVRLPLTVQTSAEAPAGSGLGTSSSLVVAIVDAFRVHLGLPLGQYDVAHLAFEIERQDLALAGGKQDQYAAAFGGLNYIEFLADDRVIVNPLRIIEPILHELESRLVICFTGVSRRSDEIIEQQTQAVGEHNSIALESMHQIRNDCVDMKRALMQGEFSEIASILKHSWMAKKRSAKGVSSKRIEELMDFAMSCGADAGKVSGAGGGGFMFFLVAPPRKPKFIEKLAERGAIAEAITFSSGGCSVWRASGA